MTPLAPGSDKGFTQGSSATYTWMVPHDQSGLAVAMGGRGKAADRLDEFFTKDGKWVFAGDPLRYDATNEPGIHVRGCTTPSYGPGRPRRPCGPEETSYGLGAKGLPGNDDLGTMSAWYLFAAMGLYPQNPARAEMLVSSPIFRKVVIHRANGIDITIDAPQASDDSRYITGMRLDGRRWTKSWLPESVMNEGGRIDFQLDDAPNLRWGTRPADLPVDRYK